MPYDAEFLGQNLPLPTTPDPKTVVLDYTHFSVCVNPTRRLAWWSAWNLDGGKLQPDIGRDGIEFSLDDRIPAEQQTGDEVYADNRLDRGHLARRGGVTWGTVKEATQADEDSFKFPNITPQMDDFNQSQMNGVWGLLENAVLEQDGLADRKVSQFAGPILSADDIPYRDQVLIPREFYKIVVYRLTAGLRYRAFVLTQKINPIQAETPAYLDAFRTYQVPIADLQSKTGLTFTGLPEADESDAAQMTVAGEWKHVEALSDISW